MKRIVCLLLVCFLLCGCAPQTPKVEKKVYEASFLNLFDTVTVIKGAADSQEEFSKITQSIHDQLQEYHHLFDIYHDYEGITNLKTVNEMAGQAPVEVDRRIIELLLDCKEYYALTGGMVNVAMGSVLKLWHNARNDGIHDPQNADVPNMDQLLEAARHTDLDAVMIDEEKSTVYISDPDVKLDVGAIAKGWSVQRVVEAAPKGLLISVGGNVCATGPKNEDGMPWVIGVQDPSEDGYLHTLYVDNECVVTSGDYQRYYVVDGKVYHHIIDPNTLQPGTRWRSVSIVCADSGLADALSTALFLLPLEDGMQLAEKCDAEAMWVDADGNQYYTPDFNVLIRT